MSKIDGLIKQYCPDGAEFKPIGELAQVGTGNSDKKEATLDGEYPFYVRSKNISRIGTFAFEEEAIIIPGEGGVGDIFHYVNGKYALHQRAYRIHFTTPTVSTKFAYYFFAANFKSFITKKAVNATVSSIRKPMITDFKIAVPPLQVQNEIVNILDKFTELEVQLEAELEARQKQYEYYRNQLLTFDKDKERWTTLGEVANYSKARIVATNLNADNYVGVDNILQNRQGKTTSSYVPTTGNLTQYDSGDVLLGNIRPYLKKIWHADKTGGTNGDVLVVKLTDKSVMPRYLYQVLADDKFFEYEMKHAKGAKMPRGDKASIMKYPLPVPPVAEQNRIVSILDKFDALVNDISYGLPAEIAARRKQYEYYRNKLLTFAELKA